MLSLPSFRLVWLLPSSNLAMVKLLSGDGPWWMTLAGGGSTSACLNKLNAVFRTLHLAISDLRGGGRDGVDVEVLGLLARRSGLRHAGRCGYDLHGVDFGLASCWLGDANSGGLDGGRAISFLLAGRGGEGGDRDGAAGVGLFWWVSAEAGLRFRLLLFLELATSCWWWLGEVSPPMIVHRGIFRPSGRMILAVLQRSESAIELHLHVGLWLLLLLPLRQGSGGVGGGMRQMMWWSSWRTYRDFCVISLFVRVLCALFPGQVAFGFLLGCGCVCKCWACISSFC